MGLIKSAVGDAVLTSLWVAGASTLGPLTLVISTAIGFAPSSAAGLLLTAFLATTLVLVFSILGDVSFNPATTIALSAAGMKPDSTLMSMGVRLPAQAAGGVAGAVAILQLMLAQYKHMLEGSFFSSPETQGEEGLKPGLRFSSII